MASKYEYFKLAHQLGYLYKRWWLLRALSLPIPTESANSDALKPGYFYFNHEELPVFINAEGIEESISDYVPGTPLFGVKEPLSVAKGDFVIVDKDYDTFYSTLIGNIIIFEYAFKDILPYHNGKFSAGFLDKLVGKALRDKTITVPQYREYTKSLGYLTCLSTILIPAATRKSILPPPNIVAMRDALLEKHKDHLDDPVVVAKLEKELVDYYKEYLKGDDSENFFLSEKMYSVILKRSHIMFGSEPKLNDPNKVDLAVPSLREGWKIKDLPMMANSLRMGSYNRGASTALGGEAAKFSSRIYQNTKLTEEDCGSTVGIPVVINKYNVDMFTGRYILESGKLVFLAKGEMSRYLGKTVYLRSPQTCKAEYGNFCPICMGKEVTDIGIGLGPQASAVGSVFLSVFLALMHGSSLSLEKYSLEDAMD